MNLLRLLLTYAGLGFAVIGIIALAVPLVPTTPFLMLAGVCLARGSVKHREWLQRMPVVRRYLSRSTDPVR